MTAHTHNLAFKSDSDSKTCESCGSIFYRDKRNTYAYWTKAKFCGHACSGREGGRKNAANRPPIAEIFWPQVERSEGCWLWTGLKDKDGYGVLGYAGKMLRANRVALELDGRPAAKGQYACHHCDNPACVRAAHLYPGTPAQNVNDMMSRGRWSVGSRAKLDEEKVRIIRQSTETDACLGDKFGVSRSLISMVRTHRIWRHVQ